MSNPFEPPPLEARSDQLLNPRPSAGTVSAYGFIGAFFGLILFTIFASLEPWQRDESQNRSKEVEADPSIAISREELWRRVNG